MTTYSRSMAKLTKTPKGTVHYWAPEVVVDDAGLSFKTDVWAFGMTMFVRVITATPEY